jgi:23S rRNA pseudoU1915 N3-methylase RlmH
MSGNLWFKSGLDNSQLKRDLAQAETHIEGLSKKVQSESSKMDSSFSGIGAGIAAIGGTAVITMLGKQILDTTAKFEKFGIVLRNTLGDTQGNDALTMISQFAATTPFQLDEVTAAFIKMANQGFVPTREEMVKLGDVASSTGKSFDQLTEALLDAQTGQFERLKEFGIKASAQGDKVTFSFKEQQTTVDNTNSAIQKYILSLGELKGVQGANDLISASLTGQLSNLEDKLAAMYNEIGTANSGFLYSAVGGVTSLIDNYETVGKVLMGLVYTYGVYKVAVIAVNAVSALNGQIAYQQMLANIGNTGATIQLTTAQGLQAVMASNLTRIQLALNKSMLVNPYVLATMAVMALVGAMALYANSADEAKTKKEILNDLESESQKNTKQEVSKLELLKKILNDSNKSYGERKTALDQLKQIVPDYHASLTTEGNLIDNNASALDTYVKKLIIAEKIKVAASKQSTADEVFNNYKSENADVLKNAFKKQLKGEELFAGEAGAISKLSELAKEASNYSSVIEQLQSELISIDAKSVVKTVSETPEQKKKRLAEEARIQKESDNALKAYQKSVLEQKEKADKEEIDRLRSLITDKQKLIDFDLEQSIIAINKEEAIQRSANVGVKDKNGNQVEFDVTPFNARRTTAEDVATQARVQLQKEELETLLQDYKTFTQKKESLDKQYEKDKIILKNNPENLAVRTESYNSDLKALDEEIANKSEAYKSFIEKITTLGLNELKNALETAKSTLSSADISDEEKATLRATIEKLQKQIDDLQGKSSSTNKWGDTLKTMNEVNESVKNIISGFDGLDESTKSALTAVTNISGAVITSITGIISLSQVGAAAIKGVERASVILAIIGAAISVVTFIIDLFESAAKKRKEQEEAAIKRQNDEYLGLVNYNSELANKYDWTKKIGEAELYYLKRKGDEISKQKAENEKLQADLTAKLAQQSYTATATSKHWLTGNVTTSDVSIGLAGLSYETISLLATQGKLSAEAVRYYEALKKAKEEGIELEKNGVDTIEQLKELFTGTTSESIVNSIVEGFKAGKRSAADFAETFESLMQGAVQNALKTLSNDRVNAWYEEFYNLSKDGLTEAEQAKLKAEWDLMIEQTKKDAENLQTTTGVNLSDATTRTASSKGFASMSQSSADELNGRFTAMQGHTFRIAEGMDILRANSSQALKHLAGIETNTARLEAVENGINSIKQGISDINTKGINIKV